MMTALIADDEPQLAQYLCKQLEQAWPELKVVHVASNGIEAASRIAELQPDVAFLDIQMPGLTGLEVAQGIEGLTQVVFVTAFDQYAVQAFEQAALDYLLKPLSAARLTRTVERVKAACVQTLAAQVEAADGRMAEALNRLLGASSNHGPRLRYARAGHGALTQQIDVDDILFFHADDKYTVVQTTQGEHLIRTPIVELANQLDPNQFWQVHRATLVNLKFLEGTRRDDSSRLFLRIKAYPHELRVSRPYVHLFKAM